MVSLFYPKSNFMKRAFAAICAFLMVPGFFLYGQSFSISDAFTNRSTFIDNTLLTLWGSHTSPVSALMLTEKSDNGGRKFASITLSADGIRNSGYTASNSLKTLTSFDYLFPSQIDRTTTSVEVKFDALWSATNSSGENGRLGINLVADLPAGGAQFQQVLDTSLPDPFGKPIYNVRIRNNSSSSNGSLILYGAEDNQPWPQWEIYRGGSNNWWLPGFSVQSGGGSPGTGPNYPFSGTRKANSIIASRTEWRQYRIVFEPKLISLYWRRFGATNWTLDNSMYIPFASDPDALAQINNYHKTTATQLPPAYDWFRYANAVRIYFRGASQAWVANLQINAYEQTTTQSAPIQWPDETLVNNSKPLNQKLFLSPNPATSRLNVKIEGYSSGEKYAVAVLNARGGVVKRLPTVNQANVYIDLTGLAPGLYIVDCKSSGGKSIQRKFVKSN
jgi:hypothetical protein